MKFSENLKISVSNLWVNKLRSILTLLGIIIGVASVIIMISIGEGAQKTISGEIESLGANMIWVQPNWRLREVQLGDFKPLQVEDAELIKKTVSSVVAVAPDIIRPLPVKYRNTEETVGVNGTNENYITIRAMNLAEGRFLSDMDVRAARRVAVISGDLSEKLFGTRSGIGEKIKLGGVQFQVIGVMSKAKGAFTSDATSGGLTAYIPVSTMMELTGRSDVNVIFVQTDTAENVMPAMSQIEAILKKKYAENYKFMVESLEQQLEVFGNVTRIFTIVLAAIGSISLIVGGIGVMNIMLVSVTERTREIGIRMAVGAKRREVLAQFLLEAVLLCLIGGTIGIILGALGARAVAKIALWKPVVSWTAVLLAFGSSTLVGMIFGVYPAYKASRLDPIEALRYE